MPNGTAIRGSLESTGQWPAYNEEDRAAALRVLGALDSELRLQILLLLRDRDHVVNELVSQLGTSQPLISQHLRVLKKANLADSLRSGRKVIYSLTDLAYCQLIDDAVAVGKKVAEHASVTEIDDHR